jgi:hypothetical protein
MRRASMPEATVYENNEPVSWEAKVGAAWQFWIFPVVSDTLLPETLTQQPFGSSFGAPNRCHNSGDFGGGIEFSLHNHLSDFLPDKVQCPLHQDRGPEHTRWITVPIQKYTRSVTISTRFRATGKSRRGEWPGVPYPVITSCFNRWLEKCRCSKSCSQFGVGALP